MRRAVAELAVTDTHPLLWWARGQKKRLGRQARGVYEAVDSGRAVLFVPTVVLVEIGDLARRGIVQLTGGFSAWTRGLFGSGRFFATDLSVDIVLRAEALYGIREPSDRLIAATAAELDYPLITRDARIREAGVDVIW